VAKKKYTEEELAQRQKDQKMKYYHKTKDQRAKKKLELSQSFQEQPHPNLMPVDEFFTLVTGLTPEPFQVEILKRLTALKPLKPLHLSVGRSGSKSMLLSIACMWIAVEYADYEEYHGRGMNRSIVFVSPQKDTLRKYCNDIIEANVNNMFFYDGYRNYLRLRTTGKDQAVPVGDLCVYSYNKKHYTLIHRCLDTTGSVRGLRANTLLLIDEAASVSDDVIRASDGVCVNDCNRVYASTPHEGKSLFNSWLVNPDKLLFDYMNYSGELAPWAKRTNEHFKRTLSSEHYDIEVKAKLSSKERQSYFSEANITKCCRDMEPYPLGEKATVRAAIDVGFKDLMVYTCIEKLGNNRTMITRQIAVKEMNYDDVAKLFSEYILLDHPAVINVDSKPVHFKGKLEQYVKQKITYVDASAPSVQVDYERLSKNFSNIIAEKTPNKKEAMLTQLRVVISENDLVIPLRLDGMNALVSELKRYRRGLSHTDNRVDSLALANFVDATVKQETHSTIIISNIRTKRTWYSTSGEAFKQLPYTAKTQRSLHDRRTQ